MPGGDGTGPDGRGGWCTPLWTSGRMPRPLGGVGFGRGGFGRAGYGRRAPGAGGRGRGRMNMFYATGQPGWARASAPQTYGNSTRGAPATGNAPAGSEVRTATGKEQEAGLLREKMEALKKRLDSLEDRLKQMGDRK